MVITNSTDRKIKNVAIVVTDGKSITAQNGAKCKESPCSQIIGVTLRVDMQERIDIASEMPTSNATRVQDAKTKAAFESNGCVTYVPTIQYLDGIVSQFAF